MKNRCPICCDVDGTVEDICTECLKTNGRVAKRCRSCTHIIDVDALVCPHCQGIDIMVVMVGAAYKLTKLGEEAAKKLQVENLLKEVTP